VALPTGAGDTYFTPPPANYKVKWTARNEDFVALRWGVPDFVREHVARNGSQSYVGGNFFVANDRNLFHWALVREEVAADVTIARAAREGE
jgi:hypothetical protein